MVVMKICECRLLVVCRYGMCNFDLPPTMIPPIELELLIFWFQEQAGGLPKTAHKLILFNRLRAEGIAVAWYTWQKWWVVIRYQWLWKFRAAGIFKGLSTWFFRRCQPDLLKIEYSLGRFQLWRYPENRKKVNLTFNQGVAGSRPARPTRSSPNAKFLDEFLNSRRQGTSPRTTEFYECCLKPFINGYD